MWKNQIAGKFTTSKVNAYFCIPEFSAAKVITWKFHMDESTNGRYYMILGRDLLTALVLDLKFSKNVIICGEGPYEGCSAPMMDVSNYNFTSI